MTIDGITLDLIFTRFGPIVVGQGFREPFEVFCARPFVPEPTRTQFIHAFARQIEQARKERKITRAEDFR